MNDNNAAPIRAVPVFEYSPTIDGFEVVERSTGRPVTGVYDTAAAANGRAYQLNGIARSGDLRALARALRSAD